MLTTRAFSSNGGGKWPVVGDGRERSGGATWVITVNSSVRTREYLTTAEIERLMAAARKSSRYGHAQP
jgi:hypothetical protein